MGQPPITKFPHYPSLTENGEIRAFRPFILTDTIRVEVADFDVEEKDRLCVQCCQINAIDDICELNCGHKYCMKCFYPKINYPSDLIAKKQKYHVCPICNANIEVVLVKNKEAHNKYSTP